MQMHLYERGFGADWNLRQLIVASERVNRELQRLQILLAPWGIMQICHADIHTVSFSHPAHGGARNNFRFLQESQNKTIKV
jgi:hypothetical protein